MKPDKFPFVTPARGFCEKAGLKVKSVARFQDTQSSKTQEPLDTNCHAMRSRRVMDGKRVASLFLS